MLLLYLKKWSGITHTICCIPCTWYVPHGISQCVRVRGIYFFPFCHKIYDLPVCVSSMKLLLFFIPGWRNQLSCWHYHGQQWCYSGTQFGCVRKIRMPSALWYHLLKPWLNMESISSHHPRPTLSSILESTIMTNGFLVSLLSIHIPVLGLKIQGCIR